MRNRDGQVPTLEDVALEANVSTATVSRCLNNPDQVTEKTRARVLEAVRRMGYSPNFGARALAAKRTNTFGAIIPTMENAIFARGLQAFQDVLEANRATLLVASSSYDPNIEVEQIRNLVARGADGMFLIGKDRDRQIYQFLEKHGIPVVVAWTFERNRKRSSVGFDNIAASFELASTAIALGHRRLAYISAHMATNDRARDRVAGARKAMATAGLDPETLEIVETNYSFACAQEAFRFIIRSGQKPTLIMCGNDVLAVGAIQAACEAGMSVPEDISITGFDDIELATVISPALTTVHVPHRKMGGMAAELLLEQVGNDVPVRHIRLHTNIVERDSLAAPRRVDG